MPRRVIRAASPDSTFNDEEVHEQFQKFLDEWYFNILSSSLAKDVNRWEALRILLDVLEMVGVRFKGGEKENIIAQNQEEGMVSRIVDSMPVALRAKWEQVMSQLQTVADATTRIRKAIEVKGEQADATVVGIFEESIEDDVVQQILKSSVLFSAEKVNRLRKIHSTWRANTDARIDRMASLHEEAEVAAQQVLKLEAQLRDIGASQKSSGKSMLLKLANGQATALKTSVIAAWRAVISKLHAEDEIRQKFEDRIVEAESKFFKTREKQVASVRSAMARLYYKENDAALRDTWMVWTTEVWNRKNVGEAAARLKKAEARMEKFSSAAHMNARKAMARIAGNNEVFLKTISFQAWIEAGKMHRQEKELEEAAKRTEQKLKKYLDSQKNERRQVMERLTGATDTGLKSTYLKTWYEHVKEEKKAKEMEEALIGQDYKFNNLNVRQKSGALKVQARINEQMNFNVVHQIFSTWVLETKVHKLNHIFNQKYRTKKNQLTGVQNLFKSFAIQLEQNLGGDDEEYSAYIAADSFNPSGRSGSNVGHSKRSMERIHNKQQHRGMARDNAGGVSLPDIHSGHHAGHSSRHMLV